MNFDIYSENPGCWVLNIENGFIYYINKWDFKKRVMNFSGPI